MSATHARESIKCSSCTYASSKPSEFVIEDGFAPQCIWCRERADNAGPERTAYELDH